MQATPAPIAAMRPTTGEAIAYVRHHFATHDYGETVTVCGSLPCVDSDEARDVLFVMGRDPRPDRMTVWFEPCAAGGVRLYGEW